MQNRLLASVNQLLDVVLRGPGFFFCMAVYTTIFISLQY